MKTLVKLLGYVRKSRSLSRVLAALALVLGVPVAALAQNVVYKNSAGLTGSLANTLQGDLQVANGRTLTISSYGSLIVDNGATLSISGATFTGSFTLSNVTILGGTATLSSLTVSGTASLSSVTLSSLTVSGTASLSTATVSTVTVSGTWRATSPTTGFGYGAGSGSTSTQLTNKTTSVTINAVSGQITLNSYSMSAGTTASFVVTNSAVAATDVIITNINSASYSARAFAGTGTALFTVHNQSAVTASDAAVINFAILRGSAN